MRLFWDGTTGFGRQVVILSVAEVPRRSRVDLIGEAARVRTSKDTSARERMTPSAVAIPRIGTFGAAMACGTTRKPQVNG